MGFYCQAKVIKNRNRILNATNALSTVADRLNRVVAELHVDTVSPPPPRKKTVNFSARIHEKLPNELIFPNDFGLCCKCVMEFKHTKL